MWKNWDFFRDIDGLHREIDRIFEDFWPSGRGRYRSTFLPGRSARTYPLLNIYEEADSITVEALAPGLDMETLDVSVKGNTLTISGEKKPLGAVKRETYHRSERATGKFVRTLQLNTDVDEDKGKARYENGLLTITLSKAKSAKPKQIKVKV
jgi:HSP20 family protein